MRTLNLPDGVINNELSMNIAVYEGSAIWTLNPETAMPLKACTT